MVALSRLTRPLLGAAASLLAVTATAQSSELPSSQPKGNWGAQIAETEGGHLIGNPEAEARLVEYMSYTCSHCAHFAQTGEGAIKLLYVPTGKVSYEVRHLIRDQVDLTAALAVRCGAPDKFFANHEALIFKFDEWMGAADKATPAQKARWNFGTFPSRAQAIASDLGFYEIMERRGYSRTQLDSCLTDYDEARAIVDRSNADADRLGLRGTPTFLMGESRLDAHNWQTLQPVLDSYFQ